MLAASIFKIARALTGKSQTSCLPWKFRKFGNIGSQCPIQGEDADACTLKRTEMSGSQPLHSA